VVLDGPDGPALTVVDDPTRRPAAAPLPTTPPARPGVLAPPPPPSATADLAPITAPLAASGRPLGEVPLGVLGFGVLAALVGFLLRRRTRSAVPAEAAVEPAPHAHDVTVVVRQVKAVLGRVPRPPRAPNDPDKTNVVDLASLLGDPARAGSATGARPAVPARPPATPHQAPAQHRRPPAPPHRPTAAHAGGPAVPGRPPAVPPRPPAMPPRPPAKQALRSPHPVRPDAPTPAPVGRPAESVTEAIVPGLHGATVPPSDRRSAGSDATEVITVAPVVRMSERRRAAERPTGPQIR
jgi:hypothetical protein